jgi:hypothetical protein
LSGTFATSKTVTTSATGTIVVKAGLISPPTYGSITNNVVITVAGGTQGTFSVITKASAAPPATSTTTTTQAPTSTTTTAAPTSTTTTTAAPTLPTTGFGGYYSFVKGTSGAASLTLRLDDDGGWRILGSHTGGVAGRPSFTGPSGYTSPFESQITGNWYSPTTAGIGSGYLYRLTVGGVSINGTGTVTPNVLGPGSWTPFTGAAAGSVSLPSGGGTDEAVGDFTIEIAVNNSGSPGTIVSTTNFTYNGSRGV